MLISVLRSVAGRRLAETENPSACATVDWKAIALQLLVMTGGVSGVNKPVHPIQNPRY
jgi:hypothetical protein